MALKIFFLSQILAVIDMAYLTKVHLDLKFGSGSGDSLCNINQVLNCDVVNASVYSSVFGIPISVMGLFANLFVLILGLGAISQNDFDRKRVLMGITRTAMIPIVLASLVTLAISLTQLNAYCIFCVAAYLLSFVSYFALHSSMKGLSAPVQDQFGYLFSNRGTWIWGLLVFFIIATPVTNGALKKQLNPLDEDLISDIVSSWKVAPKHEFPIEGAYTLNPQTNPKMTIVEYADFLCIHCKTASPVLSNFALSRPDVKFVFLSFPLDSMCNDVIPRSAGGRSCTMAKASLCGHQQGQGLKVHKMLFDIFNKFDESSLKAIAEESGLNYENFMACIESEETLETIKLQAKSGKEANVQGTPTIYVNGRKLEYGQVWQVLEAAYRSL